MGEIISHFSIKALKNSVELPVHDPISFGFEEMVKAKADGAKAKQELIEIGKGSNGGVPKSASNEFLDKCVNVNANVRSEYIFDNSAMAELTVLRRRKNEK